MTVPVPWTNGRPQLTHFIAIRNAQTPVILPNGLDGSLNKGKLVLKREEEVDVRGLVGSPFWLCVSPFVTGEAEVRGNPTEGDRLMVGIEVTKEPLDFRTKELRG